ncbi:MAG: sulfatase-like hydrolase/transferase [Nitrospirae bacterium]|nr:sulfatase-like hydrolase/transferase [Nitrospirota bacterium]
MLYLSFFRISFILYFRSKIETVTGISDVLMTALNGLRYDSMVSTWWILVPLLAGIVTGFANFDRMADRIRAAFGFLFILLTSIAWVFTFVYFKEYNEQFNYFIFNLYYDDTGAIMQTIWADYHPIPVLMVLGSISAIALLVKKYFLKRRSVSPDALATWRYSLVSRIAISLIILSLLFVAARGSIGRRPAQRKDAGSTRDAFLNKAVVNPYFSLLFAVQDHVLQTGLAGLETFLPDRDVRAAAQELFNDHRSFNDLDAYLEKHAKGPKSVPPRHIFLVVMESYDAWPFIKKYASLGLTDNLSRLAKNGISIENFVPASDGTMQSLTAIMTSIPYSHVEINYQFTARKPYPSSLFETFKRLGYRTRLFYGGYLSWQRFGDFAKDQGVEEIYGAPHMSLGAATHEWGVDDEYLLDFVVNTVDDSRPSLNIIMTTSYHPPYNVDVESKGFPLKQVPTDIAPLFDNTTSLKMLGHLWYSDKCLGEFVKKAESKLKRPLFAFTGDHFGRKFINANPDFFERSGVSLILYGRDALNGIALPRGAAGSHIDIGPTLVELTAPKGFTYYSVGQDLLAPRKEFLGIGWFRVIGKDFILDLSGAPQFYPLPGKPLPDNLPDMSVLKATFDRVYGIGWWRVRRGEKL